jgi:hypothetical protein
MAKSTTITLKSIFDYTLEEQIYHTLRGNGTHSRHSSVDLMELAEELIFALDYANGDEPTQPIILNTLPHLTGEDGIPAIDLVKRFGLEDYVIENSLNVKSVA